MSPRIPRRVPKQDRSRQRYDQILDVSANLFAKKGFERVTTNEIAAEAGISIGSLYQYFRNKQAVVEAIMERYTALMRVVTDDFMARDTGHLTVAQAMDQLLDPYIGFQNDHPAFSRLWIGADLSDELYEAMTSMREEARGHIERLIQERMPGIGAEQARLAAMVTQSVVKSLLAVMMRAKTARDRNQAAREVKRMLVEYFESLVREHRNA